MGRRILFFASLLVAYLAFMAGRAQTHEVTVYESGIEPRTIDFDCPIADGSDWRFEPSAWQSVARAEVFYASARYFDEMCRPEVSGIVACVMMPPNIDYVHGGYYSRIYVRSPFYALPVSVQIHELCHTQGWVHGPHYDFPNFWR